QPYSRKREFRRLLNPMDLWKIRMSHFNGKQKESPKRKEHTLPMLFGLFLVTIVEDNPLV
ncbi:hypothetical protein, partial [Alkalibacterium sp. m-11]